MAQTIVDTHQVDPDAPEAKVMSVRLLLIVWVFLIVGVYINYLSGKAPLGSYHTVISLTIAFVMATVMAFVYMHLGFDRPLNALAFVASLVFVVLFVSFSIVDTKAYQGQVNQGEAPKMIKAHAAEAHAAHDIEPGH